MSELARMEKDLKELAENNGMILDEMVEMKIKMKKLDSVEDEIKEKKVELVDLGERRNEYLYSMRELEIEMTKWRQEAELEREGLIKEYGVKMENTSNLFQERERATENDSLKPGTGS